MIKQELDDRAADSPVTEEMCEDPDDVKRIKLEELSEDDCLDVLTLEPLHNLRKMKSCNRTRVNVSLSCYFQVKEF